jgi:hypothetical protein
MEEVLKLDITIKIMDKQILKPWIIPIIGSNNIFEVEAIHDDYEGFRILLRENQTISESTPKSQFFSIEGESGIFGR